jgi:preprotein translocase subunit SecD
LKALIGTTAQLTFQPVISRSGNPDEAPGPGNEILPSIDEPGTFYILERAPVVTGEELVDAQPDFDQNGRPAVSFRFNPTGARKFGDYTAQNIGNPFAIVLDGEVISAPVIQSHIPGRCLRGWNSLKSAPSGRNWGQTASRRARSPASWPLRWCWSTWCSVTASLAFLQILR